ncbi:MAG: sel1 repeat family protein [Rhodospirillales bacterium]|nr:sel1 repeat family protein [Rhodospirillales bacterium]
MFLGQTLKCALFVAVFFLCCMQPVLAGDDDPARLKNLEKNATAGNGEDAYKLGKYYELEKQYEQAEHWFRIGLYNDDYLSALGLYKLDKNQYRKIPQAEMYKNLGLKLLQNQATSNPKAALALSEAYTFGEYFPVSFENSQKWLIKAESLGSAEASFRLGMFYSDGFQIAVDPVRALYYFRRGHEAGEENATRQLAVAYATGIGVKKDLQKAKEYFIESGNAGNTLAMRDLGNYYTYHEKNRQQAIYWFEKAAEKKNADAMYFLGELYKNTNSKLAQQYYERAVEDQHFYAKVALEKQKQKKKK